MSASGRWQEVEDLFAWGIGRDPASRADEIASRCDGDAELLREVQSLVRAHERSSDFLETAAAAHIAAHPDARVGGRIGRYRIVRELGRGGMGTVYQAVQDDPRREVALKVVRGGAWADAQSVRRFRREAESLARLDHPGIARILEAGVDEATGEHWFAMELVRGRTLTEHARDTKATRAQRLELFVALCRAVDHAHRQGVVHRDLKPSNLLVTDGPEPRVKVLDFGLADSTVHCAAPDAPSATRLTEPGRIFGTLPYMSPEQARGDGARVSAASDVYSLGVVLYELLTGRLPLDVDGVLLPEAVRRITESEPERPGRIDRTLRGDLETILAKALEKEPARRYASAAAFAADVERQTRGEPIVARAPSFAYHSRKLVLRHKLFFGAAALVFVLLAAATAVASVLYARARAAEQRALVKQDTATEIKSFLQATLAAAEPGRSGRHDMTVREVLDRAAPRVDASLADRPIVAGALHATIGDAYAGIGAFDRAAFHLERALALLRGAPETEAELANALAALGRLAYLQGDYATAESRAREALEVRRRVAANGPLVQGLLQLAGAVRKRAGGNAAIAEALALYEEALAIATRDGLDPALEADARNDLAGLLSARGQHALAELHLRRAIALHERCHGPDDSRVAQDESDLAVLLSRTERLDEAVALARRARETCRAILGADHATTIATTNNLGSFLVRTGATDEGEALLREALEARIRTLGADHPDVAATQSQIGHVARRRRDFTTARAQFDAALATNRMRFGDTHVEVGNGLSNLALLELDAGDPEAALPHARAALGVYREVLPPGHVILPQSLGLLGEILTRLDRHAEAEPLLVDGLAALERTQARGDPALAQAVERLACLYDASSRPDAAAAVRERGAHAGLDVVATPR